MKMTSLEEAIYAAALVAAIDDVIDICELDQPRDARQQDLAERDMERGRQRALACVELHRKALKR